MNWRRDVDSQDSMTLDAMMEVNENEECVDIFRKRALGA
jgi:hypothetical protein